MQEPWVRPCVITAPNYTRDPQQSSVCGGVSRCESQTLEGWQVPVELLTEDGFFSTGVGRQWDPKSLLGYRFLFPFCHLFTPHVSNFLGGGVHVNMVGETAFIILRASLESSQGETWCLEVIQRSPSLC